jgi:hypothetical protein
MNINGEHPDNDEFSRSHEEHKKEKWHRDESRQARDERIRKEKEKGGN